MAGDIDLMDFVDPSMEPLNARIALAGPSGGGKTYTALQIARALVGPEGEVAGIDTERGSMKRYHVPRGPFRFKVIELPDFRPQTYTAAITKAAKARFPALVVDSMSHAWDGLLDQVGGRGKQGWGNVRPVEREFWDALLTYPGHVIACFRVRTVYQEEEGERGKKVTKQATEAIQRKDTEYEFDIALRCSNMGNLIEVEKTRCSAIAEKRYDRGGAKFVADIREWLDAGVRSVQMDPLARALQLSGACPGAWQAAIEADISAAGGNARKLDAIIAKIAKSLRDEGLPIPDPIDPNAPAAPPAVQVVPEAPLVHQVEADKPKA